MWISTYVSHTHSKLISPRKRRRQILMKALCIGLLYAPCVTYSEWLPSWIGFQSQGFIVRRTRHPDMLLGSLDMSCSSAFFHTVFHHISDSPIFHRTFSRYIDELFAVLRNEDARGETSLSQAHPHDISLGCHCAHHEILCANSVARILLIC